MRIASPTENLLRRFSVGKMDARQARYHTDKAAAGCASLRAPSGRVTTLARRHPILLEVPSSVAKRIGPHAAIAEHPVIAPVTRSISANPARMPLGCPRTALKTLQGIIYCPGC